MIINNGNIQKWFFDYVEGNLSELEIQELEHFVLKHPEFQEDFQAWKNTAKHDEDEKIPVFTGMNALLVSIPFYETVYFKISTAAILILGFLGTSAYFMHESQKVQTYQSFYNNSSIGASSNNTIAKLETVDFQVFENFKNQNVLNSNKSTTQQSVAHVDYISVSNSTKNHNYSSNKTKVETSKSIENNTESSSKNIDNDFEFEVHNQTSSESLEYVHNNNLDDLSIKVNLIDEISNDFNDLSYFKESDKNKYAFLDFRNKEGFGLNNSKLKNEKPNKKRTSEDNLADISEGNVDVEKVKHKTNKRSKLHDKFKYIELGLSNINDPIFALPSNNLVSINPALAGELGVTRIKTNVRSQWLGSSSEMLLGSVYADTYFSKLKAGMGWGLDYTNGENGQLQNYRFSYTYSQKFSISKNSNLSLGITYEMSSINAQQSLLGKMTEIRPHQIVSLNNYVAHSGNLLSNLGFSSWYSGKYFYGGINVTNLLNNSLTVSYDNQAMYMENLEYSMQLGTDYKKNMYSNTVFSPYVVLQKHHQTTSMWGGITFRHKVFVTGVSANNHLAGKAIIGLQGNSIRVLYGYDLSKSQLNQSYLASHEVSLRILLGNKHKSNWSRYGN